MEENDVCNKCGSEIDGEVKYIDKKPHCKGCYYEEFGGTVEEHPIGTPTRAYQRD